MDMNGVLTLIGLAVVIVVGYGIGTNSTYRTVLTKAYGDRVDGRFEYGGKDYVFLESSHYARLQKCYDECSEC